MKAKHDIRIHSNQWLNVTQLWSAVAQYELTKYQKSQFYAASNYCCLDGINKHSTSANISTCIMCDDIKRARLFLIINKVSIDSSPHTSAYIRSQTYED